MDTIKYHSKKDALEAVKQNSRVFIYPQVKEQKLFYDNKKSIKEKIERYKNENKKSVIKKLNNTK